MKKNILQDVIPPKKSIRNIELPSRARKIIEKPTEIDPPKRILKEERASKPKIFIKKTEEIRPQQEAELMSSYKYEDNGPVKSSKKIRYVLMGILGVVLLFGISALFKSAEIKITPKQEIKALDEIFTAKKDATTGLGFQLVTITKDVEKTVEATSEQKVERKATGRIIIYNNYGTASQKLVATTRFQTDEGLIFRLINNVVVPGRTTKDGKTVAGSIEVSVEADKIGEAYNIGLKDFTISGFKGDPKYNQIYARSKTIMTGGFSGLQKVVSKEVMASAEAELENQLKVSLSKDIVSQIPSNFVLYESSLSYKFDPVTQANGVSGGAVIKKRGIANAIILDKGSLSRAIMTKVLPPASNDVVKIINLEKLSFAFAEPNPFNPSTSNTATFSLKGQPNFVWVFDENKLKSDLLGLSKKSAKTVIGTYTNITEAWVETHPFWNQTIPSDPKKVKLINTLTP